MEGAVSTVTRLRNAALALPEVEEGEHRGGPAFRVGGRTFALWWAAGGRAILRMNPSRQALLFEVRPDVFAPCPVGVGVWSYVDLPALEDSELDDVTLDAWAWAAPARLRRSLGSPRPEKS